MMGFAERVERALAAVLGDALSPPRMAVARVEPGTAGVGEIVEFHGRDADVHTRFRIASMTKSFTAAAVLRLRDAGTWRLDDPISRWVPETIGLIGPTSDSPVITLRHLVSMSAGLSTDDPWGDRLLDLDPAGFGRLMRSPATFAVVPGTVMQYSNYGYALLGEAIRRATTQSPQRYITESFLAPLGMSATTWDEPVGSDYALPCPRTDQVVELPPLADGAFAPMGGLWSTVRDLATWVTFLADAFPPRDGADSTVLCRASRREMQQVQTSWPPRIDETPWGARMYEVGYGFGLMINEHPTLGKLVNHSGGLPGYGSNMRWSVDSGVGFIGLANRTYAPMRSVTLDLMENAAHSGALAARDRRWPTDTVMLRAAGQRVLGATWRKGGPDFDELPLSPNVALDLPLRARAEHAAAVVAMVGPVAAPADWELTAASATQGSFSTQTPTHTVKLTVLLTPESPPRIQQFELTAVARPQTDTRPSGEATANPAGGQATSVPTT